MAPGRRGPRGPGLPYDNGIGGNPAVAPDAPLSNAPENMPEIVLEWMPDAAPGVTDGTWESLTPYVVSGSTSRGRRVEFDQFDAGTMTVTLETFTRLFDPDNTAGAYYGQLLPMRQIRLSLKWAGTTYPVWRGYVVSWGSTIVQDAKFVTTVTCSDAFLRLQQITLPSSAWALVVQQDNPTGWFRLGESGTTRMSDSSPGGNYGIFGGVTQGATGLVVNDSDGAIQLDHSPDARCAIQNPNIISGFPFTISAMIQLDGTDPAAEHTIFSEYFVVGTGFTTSSYLTFDIFPSGKVALSIADVGSVNSLVAGTSIRVTDGRVHHVAAVVTSNKSASMYVDGVDVTTLGTVGAFTWPSTAVAASIGNLPDVTASFGSYGFGNGVGPDGTAATATLGTLDEIVIWNGAAVAATRIAAHSYAAKSGWAGDDSGTRVTRFLDAINWPTGLRDIMTGISVLDAASWSEGSSALSVMQGWADTEFGAFFAGKDGKLVWRSRHYPLLDFNATRSQATFGDTGSSAPIKMADDGLAPIRDATLIRNPVTASRTDGITVTVRDDSLIANTYGERNWSSPTTEDQQDSTVRDRAVWLLNRFKNESLRVDQLTIPMRNQPTYWDTVLRLELGYRVTVQWTPIGLNNQISVDQILEGIDWSFTAFDLTPTFRGSPVDPNVGSYMILDDAVSGLLDSGLLAY